MLKTACINPWGYIHQFQLELAHKTQWQQQMHWVQKISSHGSKVVWDRKITTELTRSISSNRISKPVLMMKVEVSKDKNISRWVDRKNLICVRWNRIKNPCTKAKTVINRGKRSKTVSEVKPFKNISRVLCSWFHTPVFSVRNSILNSVSKTQCLKRKKRKKVFKATQSFFKLVITHLKHISCF